MSIEPVRRKINAYYAGGYSCRVIAKAAGVDENTISKIRNRLGLSTVHADTGDRILRLTISDLKSADAAHRSELVQRSAIRKERAQCLKRAIALALNTGLTPAEVADTLGYKQTHYIASGSWRTVHDITDNRWVTLQPAIVRLVQTTARRQTQLQNI